jgi:hypothetical protein
MFTTTKYNTELDPDFLRAAVNSELTITVKACNRLGFRNVIDVTEIDFKIEQGSNLVELIRYKGENRAVLKSKGIEGEVVIGIYLSETGLFVKTVIVKILPSGYACGLSKAVRALLV